MTTTNQTCKNVATKDYSLNDDLMRIFLDAWEKLDNYVEQEKVLTKLLSNHSKNTDIDDVLLKCATLNSFYSAGINNKDLYPLAKHIVSINNIDERLANGDLSLVAEIATCPGIKGCHISFASKFCNWHNKQAYPIYDRFVVKVLSALKNNGELTSFKVCDIKPNKVTKDITDVNIRYLSFKGALEEFVKKYNLTLAFASDNKTIIFKILDRFLWLLGKCCFANNNVSST